MPGTQTHLGSAAEDRKARLAQLKSLKRKQSAHEDAEPQPRPTDGDEAGTSPRPGAPQDGSPDEQHQQQQHQGSAKSILSGRNYDADVRGPRLGFDAPPQLNVKGPTLEEQAAEVESAVRAQQAAENAADGENAGIDLQKLRPKKPNWDLKRELDRKLEPLNVKTHNAIARMVRERMAEEASKEREQRADDGDNVAIGLNGSDLIEGLKTREEEDAEEERREREELENLAGL